MDNRLEDYLEDDRECCQAILDDGTICNESKTLAILDEFNNIYKNRIKFIDKEIVGNNIDLKLPIYCDWVNDLIKQNKELIITIEELEREACNRLALLEKKINTNPSKCRSECRIFRLNNDLKNLLEIIRRAHEDRVWSADGLEFYEIQCSDIFPPKKKCTNSIDRSSPPLNVEDKDLILNSKNCVQCQTKESSDSMRCNCEIQRLKMELKCKDKQIQKYLNRIKALQQVNINADVYSPSSQESSLDVIHMEAQNNNISHIAELKSIIKEREANLNCSIEKNDILAKEICILKSELSLKAKQNEDLQKAEHDKHVLVVEVADKHDSIMKLRSEINGLEEQLRHAFMQTHFKDDVIKELRRQCKASHQQNSASSATLIPSIMHPETCESKFSDDNYNLKHKHNTICTGQEIDSSLSEITLKLEKYRELEQEETSIVKVLRHELDDIVSQIRIRESHITSQNTIIVQLQDNLENFKNEKISMSTKFEQIKVELSELNATILLNKMKLPTDNEKCICMDNNKIPTEIDMIQNIKNAINVMNKDVCCLEKENCEIKNALKNITDQMKKLSDENKCLKKNNVCTSCQDVKKNVKINLPKEMITKGTITEQCCDKRDEVIMTIIQRLTDLLSCEKDNQIPSETLLKVCKGDLIPFNELMESLKFLIETQEDDCCNLKKSLQMYEREHETSNQLIQKIKHTSIIQNETINDLQQINTDLEQEICMLKQVQCSHDNNIAELKIQNNKLEVECTNLLTTISNLRYAVENNRRNNNNNYNNMNNNNNSTNINSLNNATTSSTSQTNSVWSWWRNVHDV